MMDSAEVQKLAETLKRQGLAVSMIEALEKARNIMGATASPPPEPKGEGDPTSIVQSEKSLNELLSEAGVDATVLDSRQKELMDSELSQIKGYLKDIKKDIRKPDVPSEKVLEKMHNVVEEIDSFVRMKKELSEEKKPSSNQADPKNQSSD